MTLKDSLPNNSKSKTVAEECRCALEDLLKEIHSPVATDELWPEIGRNSVFQDAIQNWESWTESYQQRQWEALCRVMEKAAYGTRPYCLRCGDCCRQGSPTLMDEDLPVLRQGIIKRWDLLTLRTGEIGLDNDTQELVLLAEERIKVKEKPGGRECLFFDSETQGCIIYADRPLQCRVMECWNPEHFVGLKSRKYLTRRDLLNPGDPLVSVIESHNQRCSVSDLQKALSRLKRGFTDARDEALNILFFDENLRRHLDEDQGIERENQLFLFGRPVSDLIHSFGFSIEEDSNGHLTVKFNPKAQKQQ
jgi:Fe-S-cluster containining protein